MDLGVAGKINALKRATGHRQREGFCALVPVCCFLFLYNPAALLKKDILFLLLLPLLVRARYGMYRPKAEEYVVRSLYYSSTIISKVGSSCGPEDLVRFG